MSQCHALLLLHITLLSTLAGTRHTYSIACLAMESLLCDGARVITTILLCLHGGSPGVEITSICLHWAHRTRYKFGCWLDKVTSTYNCILDFPYSYRENMHHTPPYKSGARHSSRTQDLGGMRQSAQDLRPIPWSISPHHGFGRLEGPTEREPGLVRCAPFAWKFAGCYRPVNAPSLRLILLVSPGGVPRATVVE